MLSWLPKIFENLIPRAFAQSGGPIQLVNPIGTTDFATLVQRIINGLWGIAVPLLGIMVLVGGFQIMTAGGNEEKFKTGKKTLMYAVIGFVCILIATGVVSIIRSITG